LSNYNHLHAIPIEEINGNAKTVERLLITVIRKHEPKGMSLEEIEKDFETVFQERFSSFGVGSLGNFIAIRNQLFNVDADHKLRYPHLYFY
jgi:hypothetical protein